MIVAKNDSATALSQHWPRAADRERDAEAVGEARELGAGVLTAAVGVEDHPGLGTALGDALVSAASIRSVRRWSAVAQPTTRRDAMSMTVARYSQPSHVRI